MNECEHDFQILEYSKLLGRWVKVCRCGLIKEEEPISERIQRARKSRIRNGDIK